MKRRTLLKGVVGSTTIGLAGCLTQRTTPDTGEKNDTNSNETEDNNDNKSEEGTRTDTSENDGTSSGNEGTDNTNGNDDTSGDNTDNGGTDESGDDPTNTSKSEQELSLVNHSFDIVSAGCGTGKSGTSISFDDHTVRVTGTIRGKNSCYTAELKHAALYRGTLTITVRSFETENSGICAMCLKKIKYESTYTFERGRPERVVVIHNGTQVSAKQIGQ